MIRRILLVSIFSVLMAISLFACSKPEEGTVVQDVVDSEVIDLTGLSNTMVYAEVYNMTMEPEKYMGKTVKMRGIFAAYEDYFQKDKFYFSVIIPDAAACCESGFEFIWSGEHVYPDDYPEVGEEIEINGVFSSYLIAESPFYYVEAQEIIVV